jgi:ABC-type multidrug transport system fused ATPase/permease subunit
VTAPTTPPSAGTATAHAVRTQAAGAASDAEDPAATAPSPDARALFRLGLSGSGRGWRLGAAAAGFAGHQVSEALVPVLIGVVIDRAVRGSDPGALAVWLTALAALFAVLILCWRLATHLTTRVYSYGEHDLRLLAAGRVLHPRGMATRRSPGDVLTVATSDASNVSGLAWVIAEQGAALAGLLTATVALLLISWQLATVVLVVSAVQLLVLHLLSGPLDRRVHAEQRVAARAGALATDFTAGLRVLKGFGAEGTAADRYREASRDSVRAALRRVRSLAGLTALNSAVSGAFLAGIALAAAAMALDGSITVGQFITAVGLAQVVAGPMETLGFLGAAVAAKRGSARRLAELLAIEHLVPGSRPTGVPPAAAGESGVPHPPATRTDTPRAGESGGGGALSGDRPGPAGPDAATDASTYGTGAGTDTGPGGRTGRDTGGGTAPCDSPDALFALRWGGSRITARRGEIVGLRATGAAAVELADLIGLRQPSPGPGHYVLAGRDTTALSPDEARRTVFAAPHDASIFTGTVAENLAAETVDAAAVTASGLDDVLAHLPDGTDSDVGEQGRLLSGGQRQRLVLARALHQPQPVLVLHEPTTSVDSVTEDRIARALRGFGDRAIVLITTSPALLHICDRVHDIPETTPTPDATATADSPHPTETAAR